MHRESAAGYADSVRRFRKEKDDYFRRSPHSPIPPSARARFGGLGYFEPDPAWRVSARAVPAEEPPVEIATSTGEVRTYQPAARLHFSAPSGAPAALLVYEQGDEWFLMFQDGTSAKETYGGGRYLEIHPGDPVEIDFNFAYNPFCAYADEWSCPLPPPENRLPFAVTAGERDWVR